ncbi:anti-sigma factor family protein [Nocardioides ultimimeridianus]
MRDDYTEWDSAYVLGALSSAERREYEDHVDHCPRCAAAVAELGMLPGLLRLVPDADAAAYLSATEPATPVPATGPARRRLPTRALALVAAVLLIAGVGTAVVLGRDAPGERTVTLSAVTANPLQAAVSLTPESWGTEIAMTCTYAGEYGGRHDYTLYVVDAAGHRQLVSSWRAGPGDTARTTGATDLTPAEIARVELRTGDGRLLLARSL